MSHEVLSKGQALTWHILFIAGLFVVGAIAVTWAWNTIVPDLVGVSRFRFSEGLSVAILAFALGALFEAGRRLVAGRSRDTKTS